jgi:hypothetical protein
MPFQNTPGEEKVAARLGWNGNCGKLLYPWENCVPTRS